jgi:hypothetical protein
MRKRMRLKRSKAIGDVAEELFEEFCQLFAWGAVRIPVSHDYKTPDFLVETPKGKFIAEVSFVTDEMEIGKAYSIQVGKRVRSKITEKRKQLEDQKYPTLLVLSGPSVHLGYESMVAGMYGDLTVNIGKITGKMSKPFYGRNSQMRKDHNTSISAIAFLTRTLKNSDEGLKDNPETLPCVTVYHNMFAANPFSKDFFPKAERLIDEYFFEQAEIAIKG